MKRIVEYKIKDDGIGAWGLSCKECPLKPHLEALNMPIKDCAYGIQTRIQGHVVMGTCEHYKKESANRSGENLTIICAKEDK